MAGPLEQARVPIAETPSTHDVWLYFRALDSCRYWYFSISGPFRKDAELCLGPKRERQSRKLPMPWVLPPVQQQSEIGLLSRMNVTQLLLSGGSIQPIPQTLSLNPKP